VEALPPYSRLEHERRFLIRAERLPALDPVEARLIEDRYIDGARLRLRRMSGGGRPTLLKLTRKYGGPRPEPITTLYLDADEYALLSGLPGAPLVKHRHHVQVGEHWFAIDVFSGALAGLVLCEIETESSEALASIALPDWAGDEVTDDPAFAGATLARAIEPPHFHR
jgi:CYTH domain-containing protein